ncbi:hypothetical protein ALP12_200193 [Pseudomonas savastanoi pv. phaseolicola]|nr:hypothetical protein ALP12_200193 [Pseudomonas savastanoi pv. phaseolicola]
MQFFFQMQQRRAGFFIGLAERNAQCQRYARQGGVNTGLEHEEPQQRADNQVRQQLFNAQAVQRDEHGDGAKCSQQHGNGQIAGVEQRDDQHSAEVIENCQCRQEYLQRQRHTLAQQ